MGKMKTQTQMKNIRLLEKSFSSKVVYTVRIIVYGEKE